MKRYGYRSMGALAAAMLLVTTACSDGLGPEVGRANVVLTGDAVAASVVGPGISLSMGDVPESAVANLFLEITRIELHLVGGGTGGEGEGETGGESGEGGSWISLEPGLTSPVDALQLSETGVQLASGVVAAGRYNQARFFFDTSQLVLADPIDVNGQTVDAGTYDVTVPSADQTGLKLQLSGVEVTGGETETVGIELGQSATIGTLVWNANGFQLSPVLRKK